MSHEAELPPLRSLRAKGLLATLALVAYLLGAGAYVTHERGKILENMHQLDALARHERGVALAEAAVGAVLIAAGEALGDRVPALPSNEIERLVDKGSRAFVALEEFEPRYASMQRAMARSYESLREEPGRAAWTDLQAVLQRVGDELEIRRRNLGEQHEALALRYQRQFDAVTIESSALATVALAMFGSLAVWFFAGLARDIRRLEGHALQVVHGHRGTALTVRRRDELGRLMHAVNRMARDLDEREQQIRLEGERRSHQDKMLAVGALAAGVAHEVNNPLAVISGVAQELRSATPPPAPAQLSQSAELILAQVERAAQAARHLAEVAAPQPADLGWIDLNALVGNVVRLMGYDRRYRRFEFEVQSDRGLPALRSSGGALQQALLSIVTLVCDALAARPQARAHLRIETTRDGAGAALEIGFAPVLDFAQAEVQRSLLLARAIVEPLRGRLALGQVDERTQRIRLALPSDADAG